MPAVNMVCSSRLIGYALNELNLEIEGEIPPMGFLKYETVENGIKIDLYDILEQPLAELGVKSRFGWEMFFKIQDGRPTNIINQSDFDLIMSELGVM